MGIRLPLGAALPPTLVPGAIFRVAPPTDRRLAVLGSLLTYSLLTGTMIHLTSRTKPALPPRPVQVISLTLEEPPDPAPPEAATPPLPESPGSGFEGGTNSISQALLQKDPVSPVYLRNRDIPEGPQVPLEALRPVGDRTLPVAAGGNGLPALTGQGASRSLGHATIRGVPGQNGELKLEDLEVVHEEIPAYPLLAELAGVQGDVVVRITIDNQGKPIRTELIEGHQGLVSETLRAARLWRFGKGIFRGRKVEATFDMTFRYILSRR